MPSRTLALPRTAPRHELAEHCAELLAPLGPVRVRRMFGGHGFYVDGLFIAIIVGQQFFLKTDASSQGQFEAAGGRPFRYHGPDRVVQMNYWTAPDEALESPAALQPWARLAMAAALKAANAAAARPRRARAASRAKAGSGPGAPPPLTPARPAGRAKKQPAAPAAKRAGPRSGG